MKTSEFHKGCKSSSVFPWSMVLLSVIGPAVWSQPIIVFRADGSFLGRLLDMAPELSVTIGWSCLVTVLGIGLFVALAIHIKRGSFLLAIIFCLTTAVLFLSVFLLVDSLVSFLSYSHLFLNYISVWDSSIFLVVMLLKLRYFFCTDGWEFEKNLLN